MASIYENIRELSEKKKISISRLEERAGIGNGIIGKWRTSDPHVSTLKKVADALGVTVNRLMR